MHAIPSIRVSAKFKYQDGTVIMLGNVELFSRKKMLLIRDDIVKPAGLSEVIVDGVRLAVVSVDQMSEDVLAICCDR